MKTFLRSFASGEITPDLWGRVDHVKVHTGLQRCCNFIPLPQGPVQNRTGFHFVSEAKNPHRKARLIPFQTSVEQTYVLEFGYHYLRFHTQCKSLKQNPPWLLKLVMSEWQATPYELITPYEEVDLFELRCIQSNEVLTLVHPKYPPAEVRRIDTRWDYHVIDFTAPLPAPKEVKVNGKNTAQSRYCVTAVNALGESLSSAETPEPKRPGFDFLDVLGKSLFNIIQVGLSAYLPGMVTEILKNVLPLFAKVILKTLGVDRPLDESPLSDPANPTPAGLVTAKPTLSEASKTFESTLDHTVNNITWEAVPGAESYRVYRKHVGSYCLIGQTPADKTKTDEKTKTSDQPNPCAFQDNHLTPDGLKTPPVGITKFNQPGQYPSGVTYYEQRRCFAGSLQAPNTVWMSRSGTESNLTYSKPLQDSDAMQFALAARERNAIEHLVPLQSLFALTAQAVWRIDSVDGVGLTPTTLSIKPQSYVGASTVSPVMVGHQILYVQHSGNRLRALVYSREMNGMHSVDLSSEAAHLLEGDTILELCYSASPIPMLWMVTQQGKLLGCTYNPAQEVCAWHRHSTKGGTFESCTTVSECGEEVLYVIVKRQKQGKPFRSIERLSPRSLQCFVDSAVSHIGKPTTLIDGLSHLEGQTVSIWADGEVPVPLRVTNGQVRLETPASTVHVGLPITAELETLPLILQAEDFGQSRRKNLQVMARVQTQSGFLAGPDWQTLARTEGEDNPKPRIQALNVPSRWQTDGTLCLKHSEPLSLKLIALIVNAGLGG